jgi:methionyl-tRNA formyltransferase
MKILVFTSNALRHKYVANTLAKYANALIVVECRKGDAPTAAPVTLTEQHFLERYQEERRYFGAHQAFVAPTIPVEYKEANSLAIHDAVKAYAADMAFVFGSSILREPLLSLMPAGKFINMHLGIAPYYRGSGTNFWPFVNQELEYVGATVLHIDIGVDTGDIIAHVRPDIVPEDTVHTVGCKTIISGAQLLIECLERVKRGEVLPSAPQWKEPTSRYYKKADFTNDTVSTYRRLLADGLVARHLRKEKTPLRLVSF